MKVSAIIPLFNYNKNNYDISNKEIKPSHFIINPEIQKATSNNIIAFYTPNISFRSKNLQSDFENSGKSYIEYLKNCQEQPEDIKQFLLSTLNNEDKRNKFIEEITRNPRDSKNIVSLLTTKLGGKVNFLKWYFAKDGYVKSYEKFLENKYNNAVSIEELMKFQPNWGYWALERKRCRLCGYGYREDEAMRDQEANFCFGTIPNDFCGSYTFSELVNKLKALEFGVQNEYVYACGNSYRVTHLEGGNKSAKNIYKVTANGKNYIIKMDRFYPEDKLLLQDNPYYSRISKETKLLRGDSVYTDACLDYYLQLNGCEDNAKLLYYDFRNNASIYEYIDGSEISGVEKYGLVGQVQANNIFSDVNKLGVYLNDIDTSFNCYKDKSGNMKIIDVGHAEYLDLLKPGGRDLTFECSNLCGFSFKNALASLNTDMLSALTGGKYDKSSDFVITSAQKTFSAPQVSTNANITNVDFEEFMRTRKSKKESLKINCTLMEATYGSFSQQSLNAHKKLKEFYEINIAARQAGYGDNSYDIIHDIERALHRENKIIAAIAKNLQ